MVPEKSILTTYLVTYNTIVTLSEEKIFTVHVSCPESCSMVATRAFCPDVRGRTSMLMGSFHNMFTIGHGITKQRGKVAP